MRAVRLERDGSDAAVVQHVGAELPVGAQQEVLEPPAIELKRRHGWEYRRPELDPLREILIVAVWKEVAEPELFELRRAQVRLELQPPLKVMRADLDARLADFERGLGHR